MTGKKGFMPLGSADFARWHRRGARPQQTKTGKRTREQQAERHHGRGRNAAQTPKRGTSSDDTNTNNENAGINLGEQHISYV